MSELLVLGISHKTAPVAVRERLALSDRQIELLLGDLIASEQVHEAAAVSTCNRAEVYLVVGDPVRAEAALLGRLADRARMRPTELAGQVYAPRNCDAARHLYRVTSGLDSMVLGEYEIQGQVKRSYDLALQAGTTGPLLNRLFKAALQTGKRVRSETGLSERRTSVASVAVDLAAATVGELQDRSVVIIGAGDTAELTAQALAARGGHTLFVSNRHADRARGLAERFGGRVGSLHDLPEQLAEADIVVASTSSPHPILGPEELDVVMASRRERPLVLIDIAVPRDVDPECAGVEGVSLYDIDDLQAVVARNLAGRGDESEQAEAIVEEEIQRFARWMGQLDVTPTIVDLRSRASEIVDAVLAENAGRWQSASEEDLARIERAARTVVQRLLHEPTVRLKRSRDNDDAHGHVEVLRDLFGLDDPDADATATDVEVQRAHAAAGGPVRADAAAPRPSTGTPDNVRSIGERRPRRS
ncbi:Glutamyl-tRNA reductase [Patulibacter medicamentivorans]|jgi:glutamyl-tRNA reductase|uniref:Glutamyl-tRNA reductase n=1 Tax=Patulibacter medicamentivorans TaxID=1097667 RepID=H0EAU4_9ACTN|nr:glutamyl-tRNA reductase [Patulibacter medicamentivorans]EHN09216.1 Glutamyl-tRNA reductase [Patulibacter medicamentivorans]